MSDATTLQDMGHGTQHATLLQRLHQASRTIASTSDEAIVGQTLMKFIASSDVHVARLLIFTDFANGRPSTVEMREGWTIDDRPAQPYGTRLSLADYPFLQHMDADKVTVVENVETDERLNEPARRLMTLSGAGSFVIVPLTTGQNWLGALIIGRNPPSTYDEESTYAWWTLAGQGAATIQNARLFEQVQKDITRRKAAEVEGEQSLRELSLLLDTSAALSTSLDAETVLRTTVQQITTVLALEDGAISLWDRDRDALVTQIDYSTDPSWKPEAAGTVYPLDEYPASHQVLTSRQPLIIQASDPDADPAELAWMAEQEVVSLLMVPMVVRDEAIGIVEIAQDRQSGERMFTPTEIALCQTLANQAAVALENARLFEQTQQRTAQLEWLALIESTLSQASNEEEILTAITLGVDMDELPSRITLQYLDTDENDQPTTLYAVSIWHDGIILPDDPELQQHHGAADLPTSRLWIESPHETLFISDVLADSYADEAIRQQAAQLGFQAIALMPLRSAGRWQGLVTFLWSEPHTFSPDERYYLRQSLESVSAVVATRRAYLAQQQALEHSARSAVQLQTAAEVSRAASSILDPDELMQQAVDLIQERFSLYYAGLFLVDRTGKRTGEPDKWAVLRAGTGQAGQQMMAQGHKLKIGGRSMIGGCVANAEARIALDVGEEAVRFANPFLPETRSEMALPLISRGQVIGAMTFQSVEEAAFSGEDIAVLQTMADQLANAIENARLFESTQRAHREQQQRLEELTLLVNTSAALSTSLDLDQVLRTTTQQIATALATEGCAISIWDQDQDALVTLMDYSHASAPFESKAPGTIYPLAEYPASRQVLVSRQPLVVQANDPHADPAALAWMERQGIKSLLTVPLVVRNEAIGLLELEEIDEGRAFTPTEIALCQTLANQAATALENARLFAQTQARAQEQTVLSEMSRDLATVLDEDAVIESIHRYTARLMDATNFYVALYRLEEDAVSFPLYVEGEQMRQLQQQRRSGKGLTEYVIRTRQPLLIRENVVQWLEKELGVEAIGRNAKSWLGVPMMIGERAIGVIAVQSYTTPRLYNEHHRDLLNAVASQTAIAIENARLFQQAQVRAQQEQTLREISTRLRTPLEVDGVMRALARELGQTLGRRAFVRLGSDKPADAESAHQDSNRNNGDRL